eukprot:845080-Rhodomonas_salina.1
MSCTDVAPARSSVLEWRIVLPTLPLREARYLHSVLQEWDGTDEPRQGSNLPYSPTRGPYGPTRVLRDFRYRIMLSPVLRCAISGTEIGARALPGAQHRVGRGWEPGRSSARVPVPALARSTQCPRSTGLSSVLVAPPRSDGAHSAAVGKGDDIRCLAPQKPCGV